MNLIIIQIYSPTMDVEKTETEKFYQRVEDLVPQGTEYYTLLMED